MELFFVFFIMLIAIIGLVMSLLLLIRFHPSLGRYRVSIRHFVMLLLVYITVVLAFSAVYLSLQLIGFDVIITENLHTRESALTHIQNIIYFSAVTLLSVGYGDFIPIGIGRIVAVIEALFGYLLPAAFVVSTMLKDENYEKKL
ncbi:ion channel [Halalkalibacterium ligniniphilum]|uniref:ion channel n=1 Tax=Halalkalibacterium ligniniphilum TaxID=1134413 RepID=UPI00034B7E12|nr:ion channel [Halalkalibacterium ligniniphilum]